MPRRVSPDLNINWKICLPAHIAGAVEHEIMDPLTKKPRYGERSKLIAVMLAEWLRQRGRKVEVDELPAPDLYKGNT